MLWFGYGTCAEAAAVNASVSEMAAVASRHGFDNAIIVRFLKCVS
jgi:hypothetical protein